MHALKKCVLLHLETYAHSNDYVILMIDVIII